MDKLGYLYETPVRMDISDGTCFIKMGMLLQIVKDCFDDHYLYEKTHYWREGLKEKKLNEGDIVEVLGCWANFDGYHIKCKFMGQTFDIAPKNLKYFINPPTQ